MVDRKTTISYQSTVKSRQVGYLKSEYNFLEKIYKPVLELVLPAQNWKSLESLKTRTAFAPEFSSYEDQFCTLCTGNSHRFG
jgi:hypothetical protein